MEKRTMKSSHSILHSDVAAKARKVASLKAMVIDFEHMASELGRHIAAEEERTGVRSSAHVAYSTLAKAMTLRRNNLLEFGDRPKRHAGYCQARTRGGGSGVACA